MAFILCPECESPNSEFAIACPKCGYPIGYVTDRTQLVTLSANPFTDCEGFLEVLNAIESADDETMSPALMLAKSRELPTVVYGLLAGNADAAVRIMLAQNEALPDRLLGKLACDSVVEVRKAVASNPSASDETLSTLAIVTPYSGDNLSSSIRFIPWNRKPIYPDNSEVLIALTGNPSLSCGLAERLSTDVNPYVRAAVATRHDLTQDTLMRLASDVSEWIIDPGGVLAVMTAVAKNPSARMDVLEVLARYCIDDVMDVIEANPAVKDSDKGKLREIASDAADAANVGTLAAFSPGPMVYGIQSRNTIVSVNIASEMKTLREYCHAEDADRRVMAAQDARATESMLTQLAKDADECVRHAVASRHVIPAGVARVLASDRSEQIRSSLGANNSCPEDILEQLSLDGSRRVRCAVARNEKTSTSIVEMLSRDADGEVRVAIAEREDHHCEAIFERLIAEGEQDVLYALLHNACVSRVRRIWIAEHYGMSLPHDLEDHDRDDYNDEPLDCEWPLDGWHFDEDNGWLDYEP